MKRLLVLIVMMLVMASGASADFLGIKKASETISFFLNPPLDSLYGIQRKPDSVHVFTYADDATTVTYAVRSTTYPFSDISIDTLKHFSDTMYVFKDAIWDIDGAGGNFTLSINVQMYYDKIPTHTFATVQVINDSLNIALADATSALAEVVNIDAWNPITDNDSLIIDQSTLIALKPTTAGRTLDVTAAGEAGIDWANIGSPTTAVNLSATNIDVDQVVASVSGSVASVTAGVTVTTNNDKTGYALSAAANSAIAKENWTIAGPDDSTYAPGTMGKDAEGWDATGASGGVDSTVLSNVLYRVIYGIAVGSGDDSTTLSQRKILVEDMTNAVEASIYAEFISGSNEDAFKANVSALALEASLYDPTSDSVLIANLGEIAKRFTDSTWNALLTGATYNIATSAGRRLRTIDAAFTLATGTAQASATPTDPGTYLILAAATNEADDFFNHASITIDGGTGIGQSRAVFDYTGSTDSVSLHIGDDWIVDPDATSTYVIGPGHPVEVMHFHPEAIADVVDGVYGADTANHNVAASYGVLWKDTGAYQADVSDLALEASLFDPLTDSILNANIAEMAGEFEDSVYANRADYQANVSGLSTFDPATDSVLNANLAEMAAQFEDSVHAQADDYKADVSALALEASLFDPLTDVVTPTDTNESGDTLARLGDSLSFQGSASLLTPEAIAAVVDSQLSENHGLGSWLTGGVGSSTNINTWYTIDTSASPDDTLSDISVAITNLVGSLSASGLTGNDGTFTSRLADGTWRAVAGLNTSQYFFDTASSVVSSVFDTFAILGYLQVIPPPANPDLGIVFGDVWDIFGNGIQGMVVSIQNVRSMNIGTSLGATIGDSLQYDTTDATGRFSFEVLRSQNYPDTTKNRYKVIGKLTKRQVKFVVDTILVPPTGNVDITTLINNQ